MTRHEIKLRYPNASESFIRANLPAGDSESSHAEPRKRPASLAANSEGKTSGGRCLHVVFTLRRKKLLDVEAKYASVKHLLDCVVATGIVAGDKEGQITLEVAQIKCAKGEPEEVVIEIFKIINQ